MNPLVPAATVAVVVCTIAYSTLMAILLLRPQSIPQVGVAWFSDNCGRIGIAYLLVQIAALWFAATSRLVSALPLGIVVLGYILPVGKWGYWERNIAQTLLFASLTGMLVAWSAAKPVARIIQRPAPPAEPAGFSPDEVDQVLATMPDITPEARNAVHLLLKAHLHERRP